LTNKNIDRDRKNYNKLPSGYLTVRHGIDGPFIEDFPWPPWLSVLPWPPWPHGAAP